MAMIQEEASVTARLAIANNGLSLEDKRRKIRVVIMYICVR